MKKISKIQTVIQNEAAECALACLTMIASSAGHDVDLPGMRRKFDTSLRGMTLERFVEIASLLRLSARPLRAELVYLREANTPCVLHWDMNHFVVLERVSRKGLHIHDPARGYRVISLIDASKHFTGVLIEFRKHDDFIPIKERQSVKLTALTGKISGITRSAIQLFGLAVVIELLALLLPYQMKWVIDEAIPSDDKSLMLWATGGFLTLALLQSTLTVVRAWILSWLGASFGAQWSTRLFSHMLTLPLDFFQKRRMGDIVSRFSSLQSVQNTLTGSFIEAILNGIVGFLALVLMLSFSVYMSALVVAASFVYCVIRFISYRFLYDVNESQLVSNAKQQSELMDSIRGMQAIKLAGREAARSLRFENVTQKAADNTMTSQRGTMTFNAVSQGLGVVQRMTLIALGGYLTMLNHFSVGMLLAFIAYADQFTTKFVSFIDKWMEFRFLRIHCERIADIAMTPTESGVVKDYTGPEPEGSITLSKLSFRYSESDPWVLRNLTISIQSGESVAIIGPSGIGKSTLARLILGLQKPTEGQVYVGGVSLDNMGLNKYRKMVAAVMQDDQLLAGTIAENISFFDNAASLDNICYAAKLANVHEEIIRTPMGYETLVGDMGSSLSGGQKQRILLARAIYRHPRILVLDEATSHLDGQNERVINKAIGALSMTRIIIAHRKETIESADRVIDLSDIERGSNDASTHAAALIDG